MQVSLPTAETTDTLVTFLDAAVADEGRVPRGIQSAAGRRAFVSVEPWLIQEPLDRPVIEPFSWRGQFQSLVTKCFQRRGGRALI
jgi:hypothetical protein